MKLIHFLVFALLIGLLLPGNITANDNPKPYTICGLPPLVYNLKFAKHWDGGHLIELNDDEKKRLEEAEPVLRKLSESPMYKKIFWGVLTLTDDEKPISWEQAKNLIQSGQVLSVEQRHSKELLIMTRESNFFITKQEKIDQAYKLIREIDPKGLFIYYATE
jgi:hypothetical protein